MTDFGTPKAKDATAVHEQNVKEAAEYIAGIDKAIEEEVLNRPLGSVKVSPEDQKKEWELNFQAAEAGDPSLLTKFYIDQGASVEDMIKHAKKMLG